MDASATETEIAILPDADEVAYAAAEFIAAASDASHDEFTIALAGGETPRGLYETLAAEPFLSRINWRTWSVWWGDERAVPPDDAMSNYGLAAQTLLNKAPIPADRVHRIHGELGAQAAALAYENEMRDHFGAGMPQFDLMLLGIGDDGHTAGLFSGVEGLHESRRAVVPSAAPSFPRDRITLSLAAINEAEARPVHRGRSPQGVCAENGDCRGSGGRPTAAGRHGSATQPSGGIRRG